MNAIDMPPDAAPTAQIHPQIASTAIKKKQRLKFRETIKRTIEKSDAYRRPK